MMWRDSTIVGFDTETTSADPETARIVTACIGVAAAGQGWLPTNWLVTQHEPIPPEATAAHGITTDYANRHGTPPSEALAQIRARMYQVWSFGWPVAGHNIVYDLTVLDRDLRRHGLGRFNVMGPVLDTLVLDKAVDKYRKGKRTLTATAAHYGIDLDPAKAHGAEPDALAAARVAWKLAAAVVPAGDVPDHAEGPGPFRVGDASLDELQDFQREAHAQQRASFAEYLARKGKTLDGDQVWPITPYKDEADE